jgi:adenylate cyclase
VVGQTQPQTVFEIMGSKGALTPQETLLREKYAEGLAAYRAQRWVDARKAFDAALGAIPDDGPSLAMIARIEGIAQNPLPADWDGAWHLDHK